MAKTKTIPLTSDPKPAEPCEDLTKLDSFLKYYRLKLKREQNRLVVRGRGIYDTHYHIRNPLLRHNNGELAPCLTIPCREERHYYLHMRPFRNGIFGIYFKKSMYEMADYGERRLPLRFEVVNKVRPFWGTWEKIKQSKKLKFDRRKWHFSKSPLYDRIQRRLRGKDIVYFFDSSADTAIDMYRITLLPFLILTVPPYGKSWKTDCRETFEWETLGLRAQDCPLNDILIYSPKDDIPFTEEDRDQFESFWWRDELQDDLVHKLDTDLLEYLLDKEIPALRRVIRKYILRGEIDDQGIDLLSAMFRLNDLVETNAINSFAWSIFFGFAFFLMEKHVISRCKHCGRFFRFKENKKYCSLLTEGRNCGKSARNRQDYLKHRERRIEYYKSEMRQTRDLMGKLNLPRK